MLTKPICLYMKPTKQIEGAPTPNIGLHVPVHIEF